MSVCFKYVFWLYHKTYQQKLFSGFLKYFFPYLKTMKEPSKNSLVCILPQSQAPRCALHRIVKLHTAESTSLGFLKGQS